MLCDSFVMGEAFMHLRSTHIEARDTSSTMLQRAIREPTGGRTGVEHRPMIHRHIEHSKCVVELLATTGDVTRRGPCDVHRITLCHQSRWFVSDRSCHRHDSGSDQLGCLRPTRSKPTTHHFHI
jgi:hypothetical protein